MVEVSALDSLSPSPAPHGELEIVPDYTFNSNPLDVLVS